ncbi:MAG: response regulator [Planctomycetales bacterium]|nr:response regulator [Planctomycetales bacterium]
MADVFPIELLLVEDNPADVRLAREALREAQVEVNLTSAEDGVVALEMLRQQAPFEETPRPDIILLDLNLPSVDGHTLLAEIKRDERLRSIPVVVLTTSSDPLDIFNAYNAGASFYVTKPPDLDDYMDTMQQIEQFCFRLAKLPPRKPPSSS